MTTFTASDFGRTLTSNGNGSDHAWGGNHFVLGGAVQGGRVAGNRDQGYYPDLQRLADIDTGQGRLIPGVAATMRSSRPDHTCIIPLGAMLALNCGMAFSAG